MTTVLVVEDDDAIRANVARLLRLEGYATSAAANGTEALQRARELRPDVVISDIGMPGMDGFALVEALRAEPELATTSVLLLTALDDRASMRRGMTAGADDYLAKPFTRDELLAALAGLLKKRGRIEQSIQSAVRAREDELQRAFSEALAGHPLAQRTGLRAPDGAVPDQVLSATVLFSDIRNFTAFAEKLPSAEVAELLTQYFERASEPVLRHGGAHLKFVGDGLMAVFARDNGGATPARRALLAALAVALAAHEFRGWIAARFPGRGLPPFAIGIGLHAGEVTVCRLGSGSTRETAAIGDAVNTAARLQEASKELGWTVVASERVLQQAGEGVQTGGRTSVEVRGRQGWLDVAEIVGLQPTADEHALGLATVNQRSEDIRHALEVNSAITARAIKGALRTRLSALRGHRFDADQEPLRLKGFRLTRKLASGSLSEVFLAQRESDGLPVVLKVLEAAGPERGEQLARFVREYSTVARIEDPHVIRILDHGTSEDHAYIAMEYLERGDLSHEIAAGMPLERALDVMRQIAGALDVIHARGILHRDLKPGNVMLREDGSIVLADFGAARLLVHEDSFAVTLPREVQVVGTPYYLSPEQVGGQPLTPATDLYSLGVMFFEMLTGQRPYRAESLELLLAQHLTAPVPQLPPQHAELQPLLGRLMAKNAQQRYPSARALLEALDALAHPRA